MKRYVRFGNLWSFYLISSVYACFTILCFFSWTNARFSCLCIHSFSCRQALVVSRCVSITSKITGSGRGTSSRVMAFCLGYPGSNPGTGFFHFRIAANLFSLDVRLFLTTYNRTKQTLPSSFLFPSIIYHCKIYQRGSIRCKHNVRWQHVSRMKNVSY